jgi:membrane fusion protein (multidrug efflux system)
MPEQSPERVRERSTEGESRPRGLYIAGGAIVLVALALLLIISWGKEHSVTHEANARTQQEAAGPHIRTALVTMSPAENDITMEGDARPYAAVTLYAKISGYVATIKADKGDNVRAGALIGKIESPEIDRQYQSALADQVNKEKIATRDRDLLVKRLISQQDADQADANAEIARETAASLAAQKNYEEIRAPFAGTITARYVDPGALVQNAENGQTSALPVVSLAQLDRLRVEVYLDQRYAPFVHVGDPVTIAIPEQPSVKVPARVSRITGQLDPQTRLLLVEIEAPNQKREIVPGSTVRVSLHVKRMPELEVPEAALIVRNDRPFVSVLDTANRIRFQEVTIGNNDGQMVQVDGDIHPGQLVALDIGNQLAEGTHVQPVVDSTFKSSQK